MKNYHAKWRDLIRGLVLARDNYTCFLCQLQSLANHIHHINNLSNDCTPTNLITLCPSCHLKFTRGRYSTNFVIVAKKGSIEEFFNNQVLEVLRLHNQKVLNN